MDGKDIIFIIITIINLIVIIRQMNYIYELEEELENEQK